jgi:stearoyl-CoA desaturase (delta-9 desaturase)
MVTKEWVAIHRKHHAKVETGDDPHSPQVYGIRKVFWEGVELYRVASHNRDDMDKYGRGTPDDWIERHLYSANPYLGPTLMLIIDLVLFGVVGGVIWAIQMLWIPFWAAGFVNGIGHWWGYRNFEAPDASTNVVPWGVIIGGEELHNNHHTYPTSAKLSVKPFEFDIGWAYIRMLQALGLATVRKTPPRLELGSVRVQADSRTLEALIANRYEVMAQYAKQVRRTCGAELTKLRSQGQSHGARWMNLRLARRWLHRDDDKIPFDVRPQLASAMDDHPMLAKLVAMREELRMLWTRTNVSAEQLVSDLQAWCRKAEESGIAMLQEFSLRLRAAQAIG